MTLPDTRSPMEKLAAMSARDLTTGCLLWTAGKDWDGYGIVHLGPAIRSQRAHRVAWEIAHGTRPPRGLVVRHSCDTPACIEPTHLIIGTVADNNRDRQIRGRSADRRGDKCPTAVLTWPQVAEIRRLLSGGHSHSSLAHQFGVSRKTISKIAHNETWQLARAC